MNMEETMLYHHQEIPMNNKRMNEYMQNIVSNNNNYKCECCPYGHHVNVDFVEFAKDISNSHNELQKIRRYQRKLERAQNNLLNKSDVYSSFPKESIILSNQLSCSSSDSSHNSSDMTDRGNVIQIDKSQSNDIVYIPNNLNDCTSHSSDDSIIQSLTVDTEDLNCCHDTDKVPCKPKSNAKSISYTAKSFVVSYEHLMSIREQMSASLKRVQDLEAEVKNLPNLRQKLELLSKENRQLQSDLLQEKQLNEIQRSNSELNRKFNETAANWNSLSELPNQLLPNVERLLQTKITGKSHKSSSTQTDVNGHTIVDTLSYFANRESIESKINHPDIGVSEKVRKRNFGVTVRPTHHHFSQQIDTQPTVGLIEQQLDAFIGWRKLCQCDMDQRVATVIHNVVDHFVNERYQESVELWKSELQQFSYVYTDMKNSQSALSTDSIGCQVDIATIGVGKSVQATAVSRHSSSHTEITVHSRHSQTDSTPMLIDFASFYDCPPSPIVDRADFSSGTDRYLLEDLIADQIEKSIELIHQELQSEIEQSLRQRGITPIRDCCVDGVCDNGLGLVVNSSSQWPMNERAIGSVASLGFDCPMIVDTAVASDCHLQRCDIQHSPVPKHESIITHVHRESRALGNNTGMEYGSPVVHSSPASDCHLQRCDIQHSKTPKHESTINHVLGESKHESTVTHIQGDLKHESTATHIQRESKHESTVTHIEGASKHESTATHIEGDFKHESTVTHIQRESKHESTITHVHREPSSNTSMEYGSPMSENAVASNCHLKHCDIQHSRIPKHESTITHVYGEARAVVMNTSIEYGCPVVDSALVSNCHLQLCDIQHSQDPQRQSTDTHVHGESKHESAVTHVPEESKYESAVSHVPEESKHESTVTHVHREPRIQTSYSSNESDSPGSSPGEATYYSMDGRIEYKTNNLIGGIEDLDEVPEEDENLTLTNLEHVDKSRIIIPIAIPVFPQHIQESCGLIAVWMNDSTTTCSKDLNESLAIIRQFWFEITADVSCDLKFYMDKFSIYNPTLLERIINMTDSNGNTCLHYAVSEGRWAIVRLLLQTRQVNVNKTNNAGYTVLMLVAVSENIDEESLKMLISDSQIDKPSLNDTQQTALMIAASQGKTQFVQFLLEKGASVNIPDSDGSTALMCACDNGHLEVVRLLLARPDIDTELEDNTGCNAMKIALDNSHKDIALLIFARNNLQKISQKSKRRSGSSSHPTSPLSQRKFR